MGGARNEYFGRLLQGVAETFSIPTSVPWRKLKKQDQKVVLYGSGTSQVHLHYKNRYGRTRSYYTTYEGVVRYLQRRHAEAESDNMREQIEGYMREVPCSECGGARLKPESLAVTVGERSIFDLCDLSIRDATKTVEELTLSERDHLIADQVLERGKGPAAVPGGCGARLPVAQPQRRHIGRRRSPTHPLSLPNR